MRELYTRPLFADAAAHAVALGAEDIERRIPHRAPMRLLDQVVALDVPGLRALGLCHIRVDDPLLAGHFPGAPIYPGVLQLECIGQLGLCLAWEHRRLASGRDPAGVEARVVRIEDARFLDAVGPGQTAHVAAVVLEDDSLRGRIAGQVRVDDRLCSAAVLEVYFV